MRGSLVLRLFFGENSIEVHQRQWFFPEQFFLAEREKSAGAPADPDEHTCPRGAALPLLALASGTSGRDNKLLPDMVS